MRLPKGELARPGCQLKVGADMALTCGEFFLARTGLPILKSAGFGRTLRRFGALSHQCLGRRAPTGGTGGVSVGAQSPMRGLGKGPVQMFQAPLSMSTKQMYGKIPMIWSCYRPN